MSPDLETLIARHFEDRAGTPTFPHDLAPDDFELRAVLDWLGDVRDLFILDVGCAKGRFVKTLSHMGARVIGVDPTWKLIRAASSNVPCCRFVASTITRLPFADSKYDAVLCVEVIEHVPEIDLALSELARMLRPGGKAVIIEKNPMGIGYYRLYPNWLYKTVMERRGRWFYPRDFPFRERWHSPRSLRRRLRPHFSEVEIRYLDGRVKGLRRRLLAPIFRLLPFLRPDVAWCCRR